MSIVDTLETSSTNDLPNNEPGLFDKVTSNPLFSAGFGLIGVGAGLSLLRKGTTVGASALRRRLLVTLEIPSKDKSYYWFLHWMSQQAPKRQVQQLAVETSYKQHDNGSVSTKFGFVPGPGNHFFKWRNIWMQVNRQRDGKMMDLTTGSPWETITITTLSRDRHIFSELLQEAQEMALKKQEGKTVIYTSYGPEWRPFGMPRRRRLLDSVILDTGIKERIVHDVQAFIKNGKWYNERGIPYRRGYLLHGPPGSGKSSFIQSLAGELEYNICILNLSERGLTDDRLNHLLSNVPERSIMLLEDIDAAFTKRSQSENQGYQSMITFSGLLNSLDGVASAEERIVFLTTNHVEKLDPALIRPGRVDLKEYLGNASDYQIRKMFLRFYDDEKLADAFVQKLQHKQVSTASLQGHFVYYKDKPMEAIENADTNGDHFFYNEDSLFEDEIVECPALLASLSEDARISYEQAKTFQSRCPPESIPTDITMSQYVSIQEKGISAFEFEWDMETLSFVSARTEIQFFSGEGCVQTNLPLPRNQEVYYWEAKMFEKPMSTTVSVGVATKPYPSWRLPGWNKHSIGYFSGTGHKHFSNPFVGRPYGCGYEEGDVIGVGYRHRTGTIFFTKNGRKLDEACFGLRYNLFPTIGANGPCQIHVNLGQMGFVFVEANVKRWGLAPAQGTLAPPPAYGFETGSFLLQRGGDTTNSLVRITPSSSRFDDDDDDTPLIQQRSHTNYAAIPIPQTTDTVPAPPSYSTFPRPTFFMDRAEYERNRRAGLI